MSGHAIAVHLFFYLTKNKSRIVNCEQIETRIKVVVEKQVLVVGFVL